MSRRKWLGLFLECYAGALLVTLAIYGVITLHSDHFDGGVFLLIAGVFPAGLFALLHFPGEGYGWLCGGYAVYISLVAVGVYLKKIMIFLIFLGLLILNISGCVAVIMDLDENGWQCRTTGSSATECSLEGCNPHSLGQAQRHPGMRETKSSTDCRPAPDSRFTIRGDEYG